MTTNNGSGGFKVLYGSVLCAGLAVLAVAAFRLIQNPPPFGWLILSLLAAVAGLLSLKIPGVNGRASIGGALIALSVMLFGPLAGAVTAALEGVAGSMRCRSASRRLEFALFNAAAMAVSACVAGMFFFGAHGRPLIPSAAVAELPLLPRDAVPLR